MSDRYFDDRVALVTGASSGIGRAIALALAGEGARLALVSRNTAALGSLAGEIRALGRDALVLPADVHDTAAVEHALATTLAQWGRIDILVANAGVYLRRPVCDLTVADFERTMDVNFYGALRAVLPALPHMRQQRAGHIVLMSSMDARKGMPFEGAYVATKSALRGFGDVLRQELHGSGIAVTLVYPGRVDTPLIDDLAVHPVSSKMPPERVAAAVVRAIRRRQAEVFIPAGGARLLDVVATLSPRLSDWFVRLFRLQGWEECSATPAPGRRVSSRT